MQDCFIIQPFDSGEFDKRFHEIIEPALENAGLHAYRVDQDPNVDITIDAIEEQISKAAICLADISLDNPNVWYELGYAFAVGRPVILICSDTRGGRFPFDIQHRSIITYRSESVSDFEELKRKITEKASALLTKSVSLKQVAETEQVAPTEGISHHEILVLAIIAADTAVPNTKTSVFSLQKDAEKSGLTSMGFGLALRRLLRRKYAQTFEADDGDGYGTYTAAELTDLGWEWVEKNERYFILHKKNKPSTVGLDDDIPF